MKISACGNKRRNAASTSSPPPGLSSQSWTRAMRIECDVGCGHARSHTRTRTASTSISCMQRLLSQSANSLRRKTVRTAGPAWPNHVDRFAVCARKRVATSASKQCHHRRRTRLADCMVRNGAHTKWHLFKLSRSEETDVERESMIDSAADASRPTPRRHRPTATAYACVELHGERLR